MFSGPLGESVPSSIASFAHRRSRNDSTASFTYFEDGNVPSQWQDGTAIEEDSGDENGFADSDQDLESGDSGFSRRESFTPSRASTEEPLLSRHDSARTDGSGYKRGSRLSQKIYIVTEDLTVAVAGFKTSILGYALYISFCVLTAGIGYLFLRWLPRLRVRLIGTQTPLRLATWVVIENEWGEFTTHKITHQDYGLSLSTVFGSGEKQKLQDDDDPLLESLRTLDYRYIRFCYHPLRDKFVLGNSWKDPSWTDVQELRHGLDTDERSQREQVFGQNVIEIEQKTIPQLLVDEVSCSASRCCWDDF